MSNSEKIIVVTAHMDCLMCPSVYIGRTASGMTVYARYRFGRLSVRLDPRDPPPNRGVWGLRILESDIGESMDSVLDYDELREITQNVVDWPEQLSERPKSDDDETLTI